MTYLEYMNEHENENLSWCKPYTNNTEDCFLIRYDGGIAAISTPDLEAVSWDGSLDDNVMEAFARRVNADYDLYNGWSDLRIALDSMKEVGCFYCPFKDECEAMAEEMHDYDYR